MLRLRCATWLLFGIGALSAQDRPPITAVLDPTGVLAFEHDGTSYELRFPELAWPRPGEYALGEAGLTLGTRGAGGFEPLDGRGVCVVRALDPGRVDLTIRRDDPERASELVVDGPVELRRLVAPVVRNRPPEVESAVPLEASDQDLVVCAIGSAGTGLPGQARVAASIERIAEQQGLDLVLLLGDQFAPDGVASVDDPKWRTRFGDVFPPDRLQVPFFLTMGDAEHRGDPAAALACVTVDPRLTLPAETYDFERQSGHVRIAFFGLDTATIGASARMATTRRARSVLARALDASTAGWRIAFGHDPLYGHSDDFDTARAEALRTAVEAWLDQYDVDVYIAGGVHALELLEPKHGVLHVASGGGGGPEVARSIAWQEDTLFAGTGGGSVWLRIRRDVLEVTFRDVDGAVQHVHRVEKAR